MNLVQYRTPATDIWNGFDRIFGDAFRPFSMLAETDLTPMNVRKVDGGVEYELSVPGFAKDQIQISVEDGRMTVQASKESESDSYTRREFGYSEVRRSFSLPKHAIPEQIEASATDGILTIKVPTQAEKQQAIAVQIK